MTKRLLFLVCVALVLSVPAMAQDAPKTEVFGGYSYFHSDGGGSLHGWNGSVNVSLNKWLGVVADVSGHYGSESINVSTAIIGVPNFSVEASADSNVHTVLVGPQASYRKDKRLTPFGHALFGLARVHEEGSATSTLPVVGTTTFSFSDSDTGVRDGAGWRAGCEDQQVRRAQADTGRLPDDSTKRRYAEQRKNFGGLCVSVWHEVVALRLKDQRRHPSSG